MCMSAQAVGEGSGVLEQSFKENLPNTVTWELPNLAELDK